MLSSLEVAIIPIGTNEHSWRASPFYCHSRNHLVQQQSNSLLIVLLTIHQEFGNTSHHISFPDDLKCQS